MKKIIFTLSFIAVVTSCTRVPISGRRQVSLVPESDLIGMSVTSYKDFLSKNPALPVSDARTQMVRGIGKKIQVAVEQFMKDKGLSKRLEGYQWEFNLVNDAAVNAWCMPGGKVVVYTGLLPVTQDEASLAVVMGHEIAHAVARHGNERMSQQMAAQLGGLAVAVAVSQKPTETQNVFNQAYGLGSTLGVLKYSRTHESEADKIGLVFAAMAGYDPQAAIAFWERMSKSTNGQKPPELLSTHPSDETRIKDLKEFMPQALKYYKK